MSHTCHARGCTVRVRPQLLMCAAHWYQVPVSLQREVWRTYRKGQCNDKRPSAAWHEAAAAAIGAVALLEGQKILKSEARALVRAGYADRVIEGTVRRLGEDKRPAILAWIQAFQTDTR